MHYMLTPLDQHFDLGFGAMANSFMQSADLLSNPDTVAPFLNVHLPVSYLYRHSIELFLKSSIVILHRALKVPYGNSASEGEPAVLVGKNWKRMFEVHGLESLNHYSRSLFEQHAVTLKERTQMDWDIGPEFAEWIKIIESTDSSSTFFRYPITKHGTQDKNKSVMKQDDYLNIIARMGRNQPAQKAFIVLDANEQVTSAFHLDDTSAKEIVKVLRETSNRLFGFHAALRHKLTGGW